MRNSHAWQPTKVAVDEKGSLRVPGRKRGVGDGSILAATLIARWYADVLPKYANGRLLDVGAGQMPFYEMYAKYVDEVYATDWPGSLHGSRFIDFACNLEEGLPVSSDSIDTVLASDVLEHLYHPMYALREFFRILRPGGVAFINTPFLYWVHEAPNDYYRYTAYAMHRMAADAGFDEICLRSMGSPLFIIADIVAKRLLRVPIFGKIVARFLQRFVLCFSRYMPVSQSYPMHVAIVLRKPFDSK